MALAHDNEGFLTGPPMDVDTASHGRHIALLREIRGDVGIIRKALADPGRVKPSTAAPSRVSASNDERITRIAARAAATAVRSSAGSGPASPARASATPGNRQAHADASGGGSRVIASEVSRKALAQPRKSNGRFGSGDGGASPAGEREEREATSRLSDAASSLKSSASEMLAGTEQLDPTLAAAKEVKDIAAPLFNVFRPLGRLFGRKSGASDAEKAVDKTVPWYRKLWNELRTLNKKGGDRSSGLLGLLGGLGALAGLVVRFSGLGLLAKLLGTVLGSLGKLVGLPGGRRNRANPGNNRPGRTRSNPGDSRPGRTRSNPGGSTDAGDLGDKGGKRGKPPETPKSRGFLGKAGGMLGKLGKGALRKLPVIGGLIAGGSALYSMFGGGNQTKKERFEGAGSGIGSIIGGAIGALGGPLGIAVGGVIGDMVGEKVGAWLSEVDWAAVGTTITDTWNKAAEWTKGAFDTSVGFIKDSWKTVTELGTKVFSSVSDWFGEKLGKAKELASTAVGAVKDAGNAVYDKGAEVASKTADVAKNVANKVTGGAYKGGSSAAREALVTQMNRDGIKDPKEQAMFMAQMDHESGGFKSSEENLNYSAKNLRKTFGKYYTNDADAERDARNPEAIANRVYGNRMGNTDPGDGYKFRGRGATQLTGKDNYARAGKALGMDLVNNPDLAKDPENAAKIATWYWKDRKISEAGKAGDVVGATKKINGGTNGLADRQAKYDEYLAKANKGELTKQMGDQTTAAPPPSVSRAIASATTVPTTPKPATPVGVMPTTTPKTVGVVPTMPEPATPVSVVPTMPKPTTPVSVSATPVSYSTPAPDLTKYAPKDVPAPRIPLASNSKPDNSQMKIEHPLSQNLGDRNLAAVATGGIGMQQIRQ